MRRTAAALAAIALVPLLTACALLQPLRAPADAAGTTEVGTCLNGMVGNDSDRSAVVDCAESHLFEVTGVTEWPDMADAIDEADGDPGKVWDNLHVIVGSTGEPAEPEYFEWAYRACESAAQRVLRIDDVEVDGKTAADLWLRLGAGYGVDLSLASRDAFVAGDHDTVCSAAWYDARHDPLHVTFDEGVSFADAAGPNFPLAQRECWDSDYYVAPCVLPHAAQVLLAFDGVTAFGADYVEKLGAGDGTDADWKQADDLCDELLNQTLPGSADFGPDLGYLSEIGVSSSWDDFKGAVEPGLTYPLACLAVGPEYDSEFDGDVFDGTAALIDAPAEGA